jgi:hypothetical protein
MYMPAIIQVLTYLCTMGKYTSQGERIAEDSSNTWPFCSTGDPNKPVSLLEVMKYGMSVVDYYCELG